MEPAPVFDDLEPLLFWVIAGLTAGSALMTLLAQNIVRSATWLLFSLGGAAGIFFLLGADFVGATQLLVYVGGTLVLVIFGVMLTAQGPFITMKTSAAEWALSLAVGIALYAVLAISALYAGRPAFLPEPVAAHAPPNTMTETIKERNKELPEGKKIDPAAAAPYTATLGRGFVGGQVGPAHKERVRENGEVKDRIVRTSYLLPFEIVSVHLLVVLIGAAYLARAKRRRAEATP